MFIYHDCNVMIERIVLTSQGKRFPLCKDFPDFRHDDYQVEQGRYI